MIVVATLYPMLMRPYSWCARTFPIFGLLSGTSMINAEGPNAFESILESTMSCNRGWSRFQASLPASRKNASLLPQGKESKVRRFFSLGSSGNFNERILRMDRWKSGRGESYHSIVSSFPCRQSFFSISERRCASSCCTPTTHRTLFTPQRIFCDSESQDWRSLTVTLMLDFLRSMLMESIRLST